MENMHVSPPPHMTSGYLLYRLIDREIMAFYTSRNTGLHCVPVA